MNGLTGGQTYLGEAVNAQSATAPAQMSGPGPGAGPCPSCGSAPAMSQAAFQRAGHPWVYAFGRVEPRFPTIGVEKEFAQLATKAKRSGVDDAALIRSVLGHEDGQYLARQLTWVLIAHERDAFVIVPRDKSELDQLVAASGANKPDSLCLVIGRSSVGGGWAPDSGEPGLPRYGADQIVTFEVDEFVKKVSRPDDVPEPLFRETVRSFFDRIRRRANNTGDHDDSRALNYAALRYGAVYELAGRAATRSMRLAGIDASPHMSQDGRRIVAVRFRFRNVGGDLVENYGCRIDVTEQFPFLAAPLQQVFDA